MDQPVAFVSAGPTGTGNEAKLPHEDSGAKLHQGKEAELDEGMEAELQEAIEAIRPALQADGGDISLVSFDEGTGVVDVELVGACGSCPASTMTLRAGIERILKDRVEGVTEVNAVGMDPTFESSFPDW